MIVVGAKGFAKEVLEVLQQLGQTENLVFFDNVSSDVGSNLYGFPILKTKEEVFKYFKQLDNNFVLGIGNPKLRMRLSQEFRELGGNIQSVISPYAHIGHFNTNISNGCNIMTGTVITNDVLIDECCLINLNCTIGHDVKIGSFTEINPGVHISGNVTIGKESFIGTGSTILPGIIIGENVTIGAGAVVTKNIPDNCLAIGVPAKIKNEE